jgi:hypothetical protein
MAISNHERVGKALDLLKEGLVPFVERELKSRFGSEWLGQARASVSDPQASALRASGKPRWDVAALLAVTWAQWNEVFHRTLGRPSALW